VGVRVRVRVRVRHGGDEPRHDGRIGDVGELPGKG
jgi:hypothetical protein